MIDISQWRASIGLWSCCLAPRTSSSSGPANGSSFKPNSMSSSDKRCDPGTALVALPYVFLTMILLINHFIHLIGIYIVYNS